jgi:hypothetical protein
MRRQWLRPGLVYGVLAVALAGGYAAVSALWGYAGFPLDDAWIHQTYARNLGQGLGFAFIPGQPSAGSTSPLWTAMLALGHALRVDHRAWAYGLGAAGLALNAWLAHRLMAGWLPDRPAAAWAAGLLVAGEWRLIWSAVSGMEILLFAAAALAVFALPARRPVWLGLAAGLAVLVRPDGLSLLPFAVLRAAGAAAGAAHGGGWPRWLRRGAGPAGKVLLAFAVPFAAYLLFNLAVGGTPWPNTLLAKQAEYAVLRELPLAARLASVGAQPFIGAPALLIPGLAAGLVGAVRARGRWEWVLALAWVGSLIAAYGLRLPVTYQHGRYLMPALPVVVACGVGGLWPHLRLGAGQMWPRVLSRVWLLSTAAVGLGFIVIGARAYAVDVRIIETEMVATARWVALNTEPGALVAAHDIGALGYFGGRPLLDLAGLISPEVIPFIRDEGRLREWLNDHGADYVVTFPGWYSGLVEGAGVAEVYRTGAPFSPAAGGENMAVFRWLGGPP